MVGNKIVLSKVEFTAEKFESRPNGNPAIRAITNNFSGKNAPPLGDVRFKVLINGIALGASDVAALICRLEDSPYFCQVIPLFTRNKEIRTAANSGREKFQMSEFEINCDLANYRQEGKAADL